MLTFWKQSWKKDSASRRPQIGQDSDQEDPLNGTRSSAPLLDAAAAVPPNSGDSILASVLPFGHKRTLLDESVDDNLVKSCAKKRKVLNSETLKHPQVAESLSTSISISNLEDDIWKQAMRENTIAVLPLSSVATKIVARYMIWASGLERARAVRAKSNPRAALFVTCNPTATELHASKYQEHGGITIGKFVASMDTLTGNSWVTLLPNEVIFVPGNMLLESLLRGTLNLSQVHTLIVSDVQTIKDRDSHSMMSIARVMSEFYRTINDLHKPRIFAVVETLHHDQLHFDSRMLKLENTLHAKFVGVSPEARAKIASLPDCPNELVVLYESPSCHADTTLFQELRRLDPSEVLFRHHFKAARYVLAEVGGCASDLVWRRALKDMDASNHEDSKEPTIISAKSGMLEAVKNWTFTMPNLDPSSRGFNVTLKFLRLAQILKSCETYQGGFRGIVFVHRRATALAIADLLRSCDDYLEFIRPYALVRRSHSESYQYQEAFSSFADGTHNLLIVTKSAEDLDIPCAGIVICYDLFESQLSHAYARARTRGRDSHLVHLVEQNNDTHRRILSQVAQLNPDMIRWGDYLKRSTHSAVPSSLLIETTNPYRSDSEDENDPPEEFIQDATTSGRIYLHDATTVVYRLAASSAKRRNSSMHEHLFEFEEEAVGRGTSRAYTCTIHFSGSPIHQLTGPRSFSISQARRATCYRACCILHNLGLLDYRLFPLPQNTDSHINLTDPTYPAELDVPTSIPDRTLGTRCYSRKTPDFWPNTSFKSNMLYPTVISTNHLDGRSQPYAPFLILTRRPLPTLASFNLFLTGVPAAVHLRNGASFLVDDDDLHHLHLYTIRICRVIMNKPLECPLTSMPYFLAPLPLNWKEPAEHEWNLPSVGGHIPWEMVKLAGKRSMLPLQNLTYEDLAKDIEDSAIQDKLVEFTRRYDVVKIRPDLNPLSKPVDSPREADYENLLEYCKARRKGLFTLQDYRQPLIEVSRVPAPLNRLNPTARQLTESVKFPAKYLIPELCAKSTIPASTLRTALLLPSITRRIDDFLLVKELNAKLFDHIVSENLLHIAISTPSANMEYNYERLELLGDAFLKYMSSIYVFVTKPTESEGALHIARQQIISNRSLLHNASTAGLPPYIQAKPFSLRLWHPPNFKVLPLNSEANAVQPSETESSGSASLHPLGGDAVISQTPSLHPAESFKHAQALPDSRKPKKQWRKKKQMDEHDSHWLGDKAVADVAEAIIGAAYISGGRDAALKATKALNIPIPNIDRWSDFGRKELAPPPGASVPLRPGSIQAVEHIIGHRISRPHLLAQALTHSSIQGYESTSYERLEFIGDAILDFMVIRHIYDRDTQLSPGGLTLLKGAMVSNSALAAVCVCSGLQEHMLLDSYHLANNIKAYAEQLQRKRVEEYHLARHECRSPGQYWLEIEPPKALSDMVESIIGAIYISDNFSPAGAEALYDNILKPFYDQHITLKTLSHHPTKNLFELLQAQGCEHFELVKEKTRETTTCDVVIHDVILATATDSTVHSAARRASLYALDALEGDPNFLARTCDCRANTQNKRAQKKAFSQMLSEISEDEAETSNCIGVAG